METRPRLTLRVFPDELAVVRLSADARVPRWASSGSWSSITRTTGELSVVCAASAVPTNAKCEKTFRALGVTAPLDFSMIGILAALAEPLAEAKISIFVVSTFDTDYLLIRDSALAAALRALRNAGHRIRR